MKKSSNNSKIYAIALVLILTITATLIVNIIPVSAYVLNIETHAYAFAQPNPAQVNTQVLVSFRIDKVLAGASIAGGTPEGFEITVTLPDGSHENFGPYTADSTSGAYFFYTPSQVGNYYIQTSFPGQWDNSTSGVERWYKPDVSDPFELVVQEDPIEHYPAVPLPEDYWTRPIYGENKGWYQIADNWLQARYDYTTTGVIRVTPAYAPYTSAPNSAHILWSKPIWIGGIVGGKFEDKVYYTGLVYEEPYEPIIQAGRIIYYFHDQTSTNPTYGTYCVDLYTGEEIWYLDDVKITVAQDFAYESPNEHGVLPYLWSISGPSSNRTWTMFDSTTGNQKLTIINVPNGHIKMGPKGEILIYVLDTTNDRLMMWNSTKTVYPNDPSYRWSPSEGSVYDGLDGIEWNVSIPDFTASTGSGTGIVSVNEGYLLSVYPFITTGDSYIFTHVVFPIDLKKDLTGNYPTSLNYLWIENRTDLFRAYLPAYFNIDNGVYADYAEDTHVMHCYDIETGNELWATEIENATLWTNFQYNKVVAYDKVFLTGYDGHVRAWYVSNGSLAWIYGFGNSLGENPYGSYPVHNGMTVADHKIYVSADEHSPDSTMWRGSKLWCIDTETGDLLWKTGGWLRIPAISDGILTACSGYDNQIYTFGKGPSKTTVSAPQTQITLGEKIVITGTVTDQTPGPYCKTKDTPCISDESMGEWMDYMYCQKPFPKDATGVSITFDVLDSNNNYRNIGTAISDASGFYNLVWEPDIPGEYRIIATFEGSNSYGASYAETAIYVEAVGGGTPIEPEVPTEQPEAPFISTEVAIIAAVAVAAVIGVAAYWALRKRK